MREALWCWFLLDYHLSYQPRASYPFSKEHRAGMITTTALGKGVAKATTWENSTTMRMTTNSKSSGWSRGFNKLTVMLAVLTPTECFIWTGFGGAKPQRTGLEGQRQETHQIVQHPHEGLELMLPEPALLHGPEGAPRPLHGAHLVRPVLLLLQEDEVLHAPRTGQSRHLRKGQRTLSSHTRVCACTHTSLRVYLCSSV